MAEVYVSLVLFSAGFVQQFKLAVALQPSGALRMLTEALRLINFAKNVGPTSTIFSHNYTDIMLLHWSSTKLAK
jgi:hypothetical protein